MPIPKTSAERFPEVKKLVDLGLQSKQFTFDLTNLSESGRIFQGMSPSNDGTQLDASEQAPEGVPSVIAPERYEEYAPGADPELLQLIQATAEMEMAEINAFFGPIDAAVVANEKPVRPSASKSAAVGAKSAASPRTKTAN